MCGESERDRICQMSFHLISQSVSAVPTVCLNLKLVNVRRTIAPEIPGEEHALQYCGAEHLVSDHAHVLLLQCSRSTLEGWRRMCAMKT